LGCVKQPTTFKGQANTAQSSRSWLASLAPLLQHIQYLSLNLAVTKSRSFSLTLESVRLCHYISQELPNLKWVLFYLHIAKEQIELAVNSTGYQGWIWACREVADGAMMEKTRVFLAIIPEAQKLGWFNTKHLQSAEKRWEIFMTLRELHGDKYWRDNLVGIEWELQRLLEAGAEKSPEV
jgi:hypothetical protein